MDINKKLEEMGRELDGMTNEERHLALAGARVHIRKMLIMMAALEKDEEFVADQTDCKKKDCPRQFAMDCVEQSLLIAMDAIRRCQEKIHYGAD